LQALLATDGPAFLHVAIDTAANVWPLVPPNRNNAEMMDASPTEAAAPSPAHAPDAAHALPA
jgi:acetolactate synthase-1/2/3 large subunit